MKGNKQDSRRRRLIVFCHGVRKRTLAESGGREALAEHFDCIIDTSAFMKPWEAAQPYTDWVRGTEILGFEAMSAFEEFIQDQDFGYALFVGLERSLERVPVVRSVQQSGASWGILFNRGDLRDLFDGRQYCHSSRRSGGMRTRLSRFQSRWSARGLTPLHLFTHEPSGVDFSDFPKARERVLVNHRDYDALAASRSVISQEVPAGIVFIDQALPHVYRDGPENTKFARHYDEARAQRYYEAVIDYLRAMSELHGMLVTVCLHPNSPTDQASPFAGQFEITKFDTVSAVSSSMIVVTHMSSTTGLCHVLNKPTILLALSGDLMPPKIHSHLERKARNEDLVIHRWPAEPAELLPARGAQSERIRNFVAPVPDTPPLASILSSKLQDV